MQADELRELRKRASWTQAQMADAIGVTPQFIGMMERGERPIELRIEMAAKHATAPFQFYQEARLSADLADKIGALLAELEPLGSEAYPIVGVVREPTGDLMLLTRRVPRQP